MKINSVKKNMVMSIILSVSSLLFPLITYPYASRILGPDGIGKVNLATSILNYFIGFSQLGIPIYGVRVCAQIRDNKEILTKTIQELIIISLFLTLISYVALAVVMTSIPKIHSEWKLYAVMSITVLLQAVGIEWYYKAIEEYSYITMRSLICRSISVVALFFLVRGERDYLLYGLISIISGGLSSLFNFFHARKTIFVKPTYKFDCKKHIKPIAIIYAMSLASSIYSNLDTIMLGFMKNDTAVGLYTTSIKIKTILIGVITAGAAVLLPRVSYYLKAKKYDDYISLCKKTFRYILVISLPVTIFFAFHSSECVQLLAGGKFADATVPMIVLMPTVLIIGFTHNMGMEMLISAGKEVVVLYAAIGGAVTDLLINLCLIPKYGVTGASIGTLVAEIMVFIIELCFLNKIDYMHGTMSGLPWVKTSISVSFGMIASFWIHFLDAKSWVKLILSASLFGLIYLIMELLLKEPIILEIMNVIKMNITKRIHR